MSMKAVRFEKPGAASVLKVVDLPIPRPGPGQILVRVHAAGLNLVEGLIRAGHFPVPPPLVLGTDGAGVVEEVGSNDSEFRRGDRVAIYSKNPGYQTGTYAQYFLAEPDMLIPLPERYSFAEGASLGIPYLTAYYNIVILGSARPGDVVLINGASGATGLFGIEIAKSIGCKVIGVAGHKDGLALISQRGATPINYKDSDFVKKVQEIAGPKGVDVILETQPKNLPNDFEVLGKHGCVCVINAPPGSLEPLDYSVVLMKELVIRGSVLFSASRDHYQRMVAGLEKALHEGSIKPVIEKVYPLDQVVKAHEALQAPRGTAGKLILDLS